MTGLHLDLPADFVAAAAACRHAVLLESARPGAGDRESLLFTNPIESLMLERPEDAPRFFRRG